MGPPGQNHCPMGSLSHSRIKKGEREISVVKEEFPPLPPSLSPSLLNPDSVMSQCLTTPRQGQPQPKNAPKHRPALVMPHGPRDLPSGAWTRGTHRLGPQSLAQWEGRFNTILRERTRVPLKGVCPQLVSGRPLPTQPSRASSVPAAMLGLSVRATVVSRCPDGTRAPGP